MTCPAKVTEHPWKGNRRWALDVVAGKVCPECRQARHCMIYGHTWAPAEDLNYELACTWCRLVQCLTPQEAW